MSHRWHVGQTKTLTTTVMNNGVLVDASDITFKYRIGASGDLIDLTPTWVSTGVYTVTITPDQPGNLYCRWDTDGTLDVVSEPVYNIKESMVA